MPTERRLFEYSPLKSGEIRLLIPESGDPRGLTWKLKTVQLLSKKGKGKAGAPRDYDALSYTWGKREEGESKITCNGRTLMVWKNLYSALPFLAKRLRQAGSPPRGIWIDAVCINQSDEKEKSAQIDRMAEVYRFARQVVVWLGPGCGKDHNDAAIAFLPLLAQVGEAAFRYYMDSHQPEPDFSGSAMPEASSPIWQVLSDIMFHDWYTRMWVVQELAMARSAVALIGDSTLDFDILWNSMGFMLGILPGRINLGPGIKVLIEESIKRNVDQMRLVNTIKLITIRGILSDTPDTEPQQTSPLQELPATTTAPRKGWRRRGAGLIDLYENWKAVSAPRWFVGASDVLSPTLSIPTPVPSPAPQTSVPQNEYPLLTGVYMTTMSQQCTEPRDRVFGVLGFAEDRAEITALRLKDRNDKAQLAELYTVFMGYVFERHSPPIQSSSRRLLWEVFSYACLPDKAAGLPSWCPDLQVQRGPNTPYGLSLLAKPGFSSANESNPMGFASNDYIYAADAGRVDIRRGGSQNVIVVKGRVFGRLKVVYPAFPELGLRVDLDEMGFLKMHSRIGQWEKEVATSVFGSRGAGVGNDGAVSLDTYWRTLVGNRAALSAGDSEFTCETLYALRDFHVLMTRLETKLEELKER